LKSESELASKEIWIQRESVSFPYSCGLVYWRLIFTTGRDANINLTLYISTTSSFRLIFGSSKNLKSQ